MCSSLYSHPQVLSLLHESKAKPEDDSPRLVLADWLEEHGDAAHAEFIRLQCQQTQVIATPPALSLPGHVDRRCRELLDLHGGCWLGSLWRFWLAPVSWHRGLLSVGLPKKLAPSSIADVLPWIDTALVSVAGRQDFERVVQLLAMTAVNHLFLDLRHSVSEERLLEWCGQLPESPALRTFSFDWPLGLLQPGSTGHDQQPKFVPRVSGEFLGRVLRDFPFTEHLTHLGSSPAWDDQQAGLVRSFGIKAVYADPELWMHAFPPASFTPRPATSTPTR